MNKLVTLIFSILLLSSCASAQPFTDVEWDRIDKISTIIPEGRYVIDGIVIRRSFLRLYITPLELEDKYVWMFDGNVREAYVGINHNWAWFLTKASKLAKENSFIWDEAHMQLDMLEILSKKIKDKYEKTNP